MNIRVLKVSSGGIRLDSFLHSEIPQFSRKFFQRLCDTNRVSVNGTRAKSGTILQSDDLVEILGELTNVAAREAVGVQLPVLFEDDTVIAVSKPRGMPSITLRENDPTTVADCLAAMRPETRHASPDSRESGLLHRLDTWTSGLLLAAKNQKVWEILRGELFENHVQKYYRALVEGVFAKESCSVETGLEQSGRLIRVSSKAEAWSAKSTVTLESKLESGCSIVRVSIARAYRHQVRVHLASLGHPLVGDVDYGSTLLLNSFFPGEAGFLLHAEEIIFTHPVTKEAVTVSEKSELFERLRPHAS